MLRSYAPGPALVHSLAAPTREPCWGLRRAEGKSLDDLKADFWNNMDVIHVSCYGSL